MTCMPLPTPARSATTGAQRPKSAGTKNSSYTSATVPVTWPSSSIASRIPRCVRSCGGAFQVDSEPECAPNFLDDPPRWILDVDAQYVRARRLKGVELTLE